MTHPNCPPDEIIIFFLHSLKPLGISVEQVGSAVGHWVGAMTAKTGWGSVYHGCSTDDVMKS